MKTAQDKIEMKRDYGKTGKKISQTKSAYPLYVYVDVDRFRYLNQILSFVQYMIFTKTHQSMTLQSS
jgi:hypothetical protein